jgi:hypothetical protein
MDDVLLLDVDSVDIPIITLSDYIRLYNYTYMNQLCNPYIQIYGWYRNTYE